MANEIPAFDGGAPRNVAVVMIHDQIIADGEASSGKNAKVKASQEALRQLEGIAPYEYRMRYGCDCGNPGDGGQGLLDNVGTAI